MRDPVVADHLFPKWANLLLPAVLVLVLGGALYVPVLAGLGAGPTALEVGYMPDQPLPFSHELHAGQLGMDCRYCHNTVEEAAFAAIPPTKTCINCHGVQGAVDDLGNVTGQLGGPGILWNSEKLRPMRESWATGQSIEWVKVHNVPGFAYFNHAAHVNKGVSCVSCHGRVDQMEIVYQSAPLSMAWCLDCHRKPEEHLRPKDVVFDMAWTVTDLDDTHPELAARIREKYGVREITQAVLGRELKEQYHVRGEAYMTSCSTCHR